MASTCFSWRWRSSRQRSLLTRAASTCAWKRRRMWPRWTAGGSATSSPAPQGPLLPSPPHLLSSVHAVGMKTWPHVAQANDLFHCSSFTASQRTSCCTSWTWTRSCMPHSSTPCLPRSRRAGHTSWRMRQRKRVSRHASFIVNVGAALKHFHLSLTAVIFFPPDTAGSWLRPCASARRQCRLRSCCLRIQTRRSDRKLSLRRS